jgi:cyanate permease
MLLGGYLVAGLAPFVLGAVRDLTGSFSAGLWALFATALLLVGASLPLTATRLRPA